MALVQGDRAQSPENMPRKRTCDEPITACAGSNAGVYLSFGEGRAVERAGIGKLASFSLRFRPRPSSRQALSDCKGGGAFAPPRMAQDQPARNVRGGTASVAGEGNLPTHDPQSRGTGRASLPGNSYRPRRERRLRALPRHSWALGKWEC